jgi:hypothetical protein
MKALSSPNSPTLPQDDLFEMERRIARRADELTRQFGTHPLSALDHWRRAEEEVWNSPLNLRQQEDSGRVIGEVSAA